MASSTRTFLLAVGSSLSIAGAIAAGCGGGAQTSQSGGAGGGNGGSVPASASSSMSTSTSTTASGTTSSGPGTGGGTCANMGSMDPASYGDPCCSKNGGSAHCVPTVDVPPALVPNFADCVPTGGGAGVCVADEIIMQGAAFVPAKCSSIGGAAGVCLSLCIDKIGKDPNAGLLSQDVCIAGDVCVPCVNPLTMMPTGACELSAGCTPPDGGAPDGGDDGGGGITCPYDGPPLLDPNSFPECSPACGGAHCLPAALVPAAEQAQLTPCPNGFCTPDTFIESAGQGVPKTCTSVAGSEGRCLSVCLPAIAGEAALLPLDVCAAGEKCAPCYNPVAMDPNAPTGACSVACDAPMDPPTILACPYEGPPIIDPSMFSECSPACGGAHCVPAALVPPAEQAQLAMCPGGFCSPDTIVEAAGNYVPPACDPFPGTGAEGRCLSDCVPAIAAQSGTLIQGSCDANESCTPCNDPFTGISSGACTLACDMPMSPPFTFPLCCDSNGQFGGTCVPSANLPPGETGSLNTDVCPVDAASYLCVPNEYLPGSPIPIENCIGTFGGVGTCVSECVQISFAFIFFQDVCPDNHLCVDCSLAPSGTPGC